ncbi:MAG: hypothetical protein C4K47_08865 [Candidatus Thorarchaeota archaeon]|nr:MAG: hypothetical protein C4K47_08865 [Candidatus Thorarchaeota archaeon]
MEENTGPGPAPIEPGRPEFRVDAVGLVSRTFGLWSRRIVGYITISAIAAIGLTALEAGVFLSLFGAAGLSNVGEVSADPLSFLLSLVMSTTITSFFTVMAILMIVEMVVYAVVGGAVTKLAMDNYSSPQGGTVGDSVSFAFGRVPTLIGSQLVVSLISTAILIPLVLVLLTFLTIDIYSPEAVTFALYAIVIMFFSLAAVLYVTMRFAPLVAVVIGEGLSAVESIKRTFSLTGHRFWHIFGARVLLMIIVMLFSVVITLFVGMITSNVDPLYSIVYGVIAALLLNPLDYVFQAVLWKDLLAREGMESQQQLW